MKRNIIIKGAGFENKGAQAMCLIAMNEIHRRYPEHRIIVMENSEKQWKHEYDFQMDCKFIPQKLCCAKIHTMLSTTLRLINHDKEWKNMDGLLKFTDMIIDVSGFTLSSQWGMEASVNYIYEIAVAKYYKIPIYLLPQSFGPFQYAGVLENGIIHILLGAYMNYPKLICAREKEGYYLLKPYTSGNLRFCRDMVLCYKGKIEECIRARHIADVTIGEGDEHTVLIMPSVRITSHGKGKEDSTVLYQKMIEELLHYQAQIYLFAHSSEDKGLCQSIQKQFGKNENVKFLDCDLTPQQIEHLISQFDYAILSRYHGIVHAYRQSVPCIVCGWATKYKELLELFGQSRYFCDVRDSTENQNVFSCIRVMEKNYVQEQKKIHYIRPLLKNKFDFRWIEQEKI